jgi:DNA-binding transcriptional MerR regulator
VAGVVAVEKSPEAFRTISEVADALDVPQHVLRFWEGKFSQVKPMKRGGGRRYYRPQDIDLLRGIRHLLYGEGFTIRGVQKILREQGIQYVMATGASGAVPTKPAGVSAGDLPEASQEAAEAAGLNKEQVRLLQASLYELSELKKRLNELGE